MTPSAKATGSFSASWNLQEQEILSMEGVFNLFSQHRDEANGSLWDGAEHKEERVSPVVQEEGSGRMCPTGS
jgi:hypothetical protein